jgi:CheY-like chemotaxis protein
MAKILVVDDEKAIRNALRDILEHEKHTVDEAEDGSSALDKAKKASSIWCSATSRCPRWMGWSSSRRSPRTTMICP